MKTNIVFKNKKFNVIELVKKGKIIVKYEYYLEKINYENLFFMYSTLTKNRPTNEDVKKFISRANKLNFWKD